MEPTELTRATARRLEPHAAERLAGIDGELASRAAACSRQLDGPATRPGAGLYPHQWSWDSAFIASVYSPTGRSGPRGSCGDSSRASGPTACSRTSASPPAGATSRGPTSGRRERSPDAPAESAHLGNRPAARARNRGVASAARPGRRGDPRAFALAPPRLEAWHAYLYRERTREDGGLVEIWHPWESGIDNSPLWDDALARMPCPRASPHFGRVDVELVDPVSAPATTDYDRYAYLVKLYRDGDYDAASRSRRVSVRVRESFSTRCSSRPIATSRRSRASWAPNPEPFETFG